MGKVKTHRASAKRFTVTGTGKVKIYHAQHRHNLGKKTSKRKRNLRKGTYVAASDASFAKKLIPYK